MREIESQPSLDVENVTAEKPENITSTSTTEDMSEYDSDDIEYDSDEITYLSDMESGDDDEYDSDDIEYDSDDITYLSDLESDDDDEYDSDEITYLSDLESDDENSVDNPVNVKVKTAKACIEKVKTQKRKLNLSVEIVMDNKKRKLSF